jgi:hypothetical protein
VKSFSRHKTAGDGGAGGTAPIHANQQFTLANPKTQLQYIPIAYFAVV